MFDINTIDAREVKIMLCDTCNQLREVHEDHIVCNIQCAKMANVEKCSFYEEKEE